MKESNFSVSAMWSRVACAGDVAAAAVAHIRYLVHPRISVITTTFPLALAEL
jgi:hypothetical protein